MQGACEGGAVGVGERLKEPDVPQEFRDVVAGQKKTPYVRIITLTPA